MKRKLYFSALWLLCAVLVISAVIFVPYFTSGKAFILGWDMRTIYSSNFENLRTMVDAFRENHTLPYWSWVNFLGNDFYSSKLFYFNDFFEYFFVFTKLPYSEAIVWMTFPWASVRWKTATVSPSAWGSKWNTCQTWPEKRGSVSSSAPVRFTERNAGSYSAASQFVPSAGLHLR